MERSPLDDVQPRRDAPPPRAAPARPTGDALEPADVETCDWCGSTDLWWRNCKLLCRGCSGIVKSCGDL